MTSLVTPQSTRIGWIGTGVMGRSMAGHLVRAGYRVTVHSRTADRARPVLELGARWVGSIAEVAADSDVVFTMVGMPDDFRAVTLAAGGLVEHLRADMVLVDMGTNAPELARTLAAEAARRGAHSIDAPVSGGDVGAREARLSIMIGGDERVVAALAPIWQTLGKTFVRQGGPGMGQHTKLANQILIASGMIGVCEGLLYGYRAGLDLDRMLESVASGAAGSWSLSNYGPRIIKGNFDPGFFVEHFIKDMAIALDESRRMGLSLPGLGLAQQLYLAVRAQGGADRGTHSLHLALSRLSGIDWTARAPSPNEAG